MPESREGQLEPVKPPLHGRVVWDEPADSIFERIAKGAWNIVKKAGAEFVEHAPEIAMNVAKSYASSYAEKGRNVSAFTDFDDSFNVNMGKALHKSNPYKRPPAGLPEYKNSGKTSAERLRNFVRETRDIDIDARRNAYKNHQDTAMRGIANNRSGLFDGARIRPEIPVRSFEQQGGGFGDVEKQPATRREAPMTDPNFVRRNLAHGKRPVTSAEAIARAMQIEAEEEYLRMLERARKLVAKREADEQWLRDSLGQKKASSAPKESGLIRVGKLYSDWREPAGRKIDSFTAKTWSGSDPFNTEEQQANSAKEMAAAIRKIGPVKRLIITGHGQASGIGQAPDDSGAVLQGNLYEAFEPYITNEVVPPREIYVFACSTAKEDFSIAWQLSVLLKNSVIIAPTEEMKAPWNIPVPYVKFKNGKIFK